MYKKDLEKSEILQGDIFQNFTYIRWADEENDEVKIPFFVVLTQACDLEQDFKERDKEKYEKRDKYLPSLLICPAYIAMLVKEGKHLEQDNLLREQYPDKPRWNAIISNNHARYHFLKSDTSIGLPELIIDFKHYYTIWIIAKLSWQYRLYCSLKLF